MTIRFSSLGSGSKGNATLVESQNSLLMIDCGFTIKETCQRLTQLGRSPEDINAILVTHEHGDHIKGVGPFARKFNIPVHMSHGTAQSTALGKLPNLSLINLHRPFRVGDIDIIPVAVPHDAREPCQFIFRQANLSLGLLTDLGGITPHIVESFNQCDGLMLECNHDSHMLATGPYHQSLKLRVGGRWGHLNNAQASDFLARIETKSLQHLVICHISQQNNTEALAKEAVSSEFTHGGNLVMAKQDQWLDWLELS